MKRESIFLEEGGVVEYINCAIKCKNCGTVWHTRVYGKINTIENRFTKELASKLEGAIFEVNECLQCSVVE